MFCGILGKEFPEQIKQSSVFQDFNLDVFLERTTNLARGYDIKELFYYIPEERDEILYRRQITEDMMQEGVRDVFEEYATRIVKVKEYEKESFFVNNDLQSLKYHADSMYLFAKAVEGLVAGLQEKKTKTPAMEELKSYLQDYITSADYQKWKVLVEQIHEKLDEHFLYFSVQKNKIILEQEEKESDFLERIKIAFAVPGQEAKGFKAAKEEQLSAFEESLAKRLIYREKLEKPLKQLSRFEPDEKLLCMGHEVQMYLIFLRFADIMKESGAVFCLPQEGQELEITEGYDLALSIKNRAKGVISNDFSLKKEEYFAVITGANGGGKTTFARMAGQVVYFSQMGLLAPCKAAKLPCYAGMISHFSKEESSETGKGKLMEELIRLKPMMVPENKNYFVVLNELFTTAASFDAGIMGKRVLTHFIGKDCKGIYVTHIQELAEEDEQIVSMVAQLEEDHKTRSFRIVRKPASEGEYEDSIITKYSMTYEQMKEVIGG